MPLKVTVTEKKKGIYIIVPDGQIDTQTAPELEKTLSPLLTINTKMLAFNLEHTTYISSLGLSVLFRARQIIKDYKGRVIFVKVPDKIKEVFKTVKLIPDAMFASLEEADEMLDSFLDAVQKGKIGPGKDQI